MKYCTSCKAGEIEDVEAVARVLTAPSDLIETHGRWLCEDHAEIMIEDGLIMGKKVILEQLDLVREGQI